MALGPTPGLPGNWNTWENYKSIPAPSAAVSGPADSGSLPEIGVQAAASTGAVGPAANGGPQADSTARARAEAKAAEIQRQQGCQTCKQRTYQDGSNDPGVSFKSPQSINPDMAASVVLGHEMEHVTREQAKAQAEDAEVVSQSVRLHTAICPECGRSYVSGGVTETVTAKRQNQSKAEFSAGQGGGAVLAAALSGQA